MAENETTAEEKAESYVSDQLALKTWSVIARELHEGGCLITLHKAWDSKDKEFIIFPTYRGQDPDQMKPDVWMVWRHELKPPMAGHTRIRDYAEVVEAIPIQSVGALRGIDHEHALTNVEAARRFGVGEPGLVALVLRVYHLPRSYKFDDVVEKEGDTQFVPLPFDVQSEGSTPAVADDDFERRLARIKAALA